MCGILCAAERKARRGIRIKCKSIAFYRTFYGLKNHFWSPHLSLRLLQATVEHLKEATEPDAQHHDKDIQVGPRECERQIDYLKERYLPNLEIDDVVDVRPPVAVKRFQDWSIQIAHSPPLQQVEDGNGAVEDRVHWER